MSEELVSPPKTVFIVLLLFDNLIVLGVREQLLKRPVLLLELIFRNHLLLLLLFLFS